MISSRDKSILRRLAKNIYRACGKIDLQTTYHPCFDKDYAVEWLQKDIKKVFGKYHNKKRLSEEAKSLLETHEKKILNSIPSYVEQKKKELGYSPHGKQEEETKKPSKFGKIFNPFTIPIAIGLLAPVGIEVYCAISGDPTPRNAFYSGVINVLDKLPYVEVDPLSNYYAQPLTKFLTNETAVLVPSVTVGFIADEIAKPVSEKRRRWKQYKPLHRQVKQQLGI
ncbi:MAG: hypothetical protein KAW40_06065 [Candidatus Aenigmarchaeota archaeon]|nr:hypothetical protein [Candidatus Aenigmarchaeota archaeon]